MIDIKVDFAQKTIALTSGRDVLHCRRTDSREVLATVLNQCVIHSGSLKVRERCGSLAPKAIPRISCCWVPERKKFRRGIEIAFLDDGLSLEVIAADRCYRASMLRSRLGPADPPGRRVGTGLVLPYLGKRDVTA